ncbi:MAG TPA: hypothetical protein ENK78_01075 [Thiothrix sp.]|nr:hypothetical protein [Thiothrix sp.]
MRVLWIHIGLDKTGTTALQTVFSINPKILESLNLCYLKSGRKHFMNHHQLYHDALENKYTEWEKLHNELLSLPEGTQGLISFEGFYHLSADCIQIIADIFKGCELNVVIYLRRQSDLICSGFAQRAKARKFLLGVHEDKIINHTQNYLLILKKWESIVSKKKVNVRLYDKAAMKEGSIIVDFLSILGKDISSQEIKDNFYLPKANVNPTFDIESLHALNALDESGELNNDNLYRSVVHFLLGKVSNDRSTFVKDATINEIDLYHEPTNQVIAKRWFKRDNLFLSPPVFKHRLPDWERVERLKREVKALYPWLAMKIWQGQRTRVAVLYQQGMLYGFPNVSLTFPLYISRSTTLVIHINPPAMCDLMFSIEGSWKSNGELLMTVNDSYVGKSSSKLFEFRIGSDIYAKRGNLLFISMEVISDTAIKHNAAFRVDTIKYLKLLEKS